MDTGRFLVEGLRCAISGESLPWDPEIDWQTLWALARFHNVEGLMYRALKDSGGVPEELCKKLEGAFQYEVYRYIQQESTAENLRQALTQAEVPHILLRGAVLRRDYPSPDARTMADLDYLVRLEDYPAIHQAVGALGGRHIHTDGGHFTWELPPSVRVEFHPDLIYVDSPVGTTINPGWQYADPDSGPYALRLSEEGFYLNMICHLAYSFSSGGNGVRSVLDLWVYQTRHTPQADRGAVSSQLEGAGLLQFEQTVLALSRAWFGGGAMTKELDQLGRYVLQSGSRGTLAHAVRNAACFSGGKTGFSALVGQVFRSRAELENRFPWMKGRSWLIPAAWFLRMGRAVFRHTEQIEHWRRAAARLSPEEVAEQRERLRQFGLLEDGTKGLG